MRLIRPQTDQTTDWSDHRHNTKN